MQGMKRLCLRPARDAVFNSIYGDQRAQLLYEFFKCGADVYVLAGSLRDAVAAHYEGEGDGIARDFDIAVTHVSRADFDALLQAFGRRNRHGGYVLHTECAPDWDLWYLEDTIGLRKTGSPCSVENVLRSFNLDCNAIALDAKTGLFLDAGAIKAIQQKRIGFVEHAIRHSEETFAAKALLLDLRLKYTLASDLRRFVNARLDYSCLEHEMGKLFPGFAGLPMFGTTVAPTEPMQSASLKGLRPALKRGISIATYSATIG